MQNVGQEYQRDVAPRYAAAVDFTVISMGSEFLASSHPSAMAFISLGFGAK
jgi:hypothetical protein